MKEKIGIIGFGNMGSAIAQQLKDNYQIFVFDKDRNKTSNVSDISVASNNAALIQQVDTVILAVKPRDFEALLEEVKAGIKNQLVISIAAGITTGYLEKILGRIRVIRVMPNLPAKIGQGISCLTQGRFATISDLDFAKNLFGYLGKTLQIKEEMMNAATAISGSGPAYVCHFIISESMDINNIPEQKKQDFLSNFQKVAEKLGFSPEEAALLVSATFSGTLDFLKKTNISPQELEKQVASKGGTTEAALAVLQRNGSLEEAVKAARRRAEELAKKTYYNVHL